MAHFAMESPNGPNQTFTVFLKYQESVKKVHVPIVSTISELYRITKEKFQLFHAQIFVLYVNDREFGCDCELEQMEQLWDGAIVTIHSDKSNPIRSDSIQRIAIQSIDHKSSAPQDQTSNQYDAFLNKLQGRSIAEIVRSLSNADSLQAFIWDITGQPGAYSQLSIEPGMDKLFQAFQSIAQLKEGRYQEMHGFCKDLMMSVKSEGILVPWRRSFKPMLRGAKYWTAHMSWRHELMRNHMRNHTWVIKNVNDSLQPTTRKHKHVLEEDARTLLMKRLNEPHNLPLWLKLGFFPPQNAWETESLTDFKLVVLPREHDVDNGWCQYWVKITFKNTCDPYRNYLRNFLTAHSEHIIGWEWMIEPDLSDTRISVHDLMHSPQATDLRKTMFAKIPTLGNIYRAKCNVANVRVDFDLIEREQKRLQHYVYGMHEITNYNPYRAPKDVRLAIEKKKRREKAIAEQLRQDRRFANNQHEHRPSFPVHVPKNNNANQHGHHREGRRNRSRNMNSHSRALSRSRSRSRRHRIKREEESKYY
eukprot:1119234_1